jgi:protein disulfide-isomerase A1
MDLYYQYKYNKYKTKYLNTQTNLNNQTGGGDDKHQIYLFKAEWCGHCNRFKPEWKKLQNNKNLQSKYEFITVDSNKDPTIVNEWKIDGFPTIMIKKGTDAVEYQGKNNADAIIEFLNKN